MKLFILFLMLFTSFEVFSQERSLICKCTQETYKVKSLQFYIRNSPFDKELIGTAQIVNGVATFVKDIPETDTYFMQDPDNEGQGIMFIWDSNLLIDVDCNNVGKSVVMNSALTAELGTVSSINYSLNIEPLKILNKELDDCIQRNELSKLNPCKEIKDRRDKFSRESQGNFEKYIIEYVKSNPDSFVSLYFLTFGGPSLGVKPEYLDAFKSLSPRLKSHRKAKMYDGIR